MSCLDQYTVCVGSSQCICSCLPHFEPRMGSWVITVSILETCLRTLQTDLNNCCPCQSRSPHIPETQTRPPDHEPFLRPCGTHPLLMSQLYISPHRSVYNCLVSLCWHKQNTRGTPVWSCCCTVERDYTVSYEAESYNC